MLEPADHEDAPQQLLIRAPHCHTASPQFCGLGQRLAVAPRWGMEVGDSSSRSSSVGSAAGREHDDGAAGAAAQPSASHDFGAEVSIMERAEQMMQQLEHGAPESQPADEPLPLFRSAEDEAAASHLQRGALHLSREERGERQTNNVFRIIRQQMRGDRSLYGKKLADAQRVFAL